jgi:hypothetical protein
MLESVIGMKNTKENEMTQLKHSNWQYKSDQILETTGFYSA